MKTRNAQLISCAVHAGLFLVLVVSPMARYQPTMNVITVNLEPELEENEFPEPPAPEPPQQEVEKPKPEVSDELIRDLRERAKQPTVKPTATRKPTNTPTKKPTATRKPTERPTAKPTPTHKPTPKPSPTARPSSTPTPPPTAVPNAVPLAELANRLTPPADSGKPSKDALSTISIGNMESADAVSYAIQLNSHLKRFWRPPSVRPPEAGEYATIVTFTIDRQGHISNVRIVFQSGWVVMDRTVLDAIKRADPVPPLPPTFPSGTVDVRVPFILETGRN